MTKIRLDHHDQKEPTTTERVYRHLFAAVRAAHSGHAFAVLEHYDKAMTLEATELALAISIYDLRAVAMDVFGLRDLPCPTQFLQVLSFERYSRELPANPDGDWWEQHEGTVSGCTISYSKIEHPRRPLPC
jgi:hypothetical protein